MLMLTRAKWQQSHRNQEATKQNVRLQQLKAKCSIKYTHFKCPIAFLVHFSSAQISIIRNKSLLQILEGKLKFNFK